jgi:hypothetical protein
MDPLGNLLFVECGSPFLSESEREKWKQEEEEGEREGGYMEGEGERSG